MGSLAGTNMKTWLSAQTILDQIAQDLPRVFRNNRPIPIIDFDEKLGEEDGLHTVQVLSHVFVVFCYKEDNFCIIGDDGNQFINKENYSPKARGI